MVSRGDERRKFLFQVWQNLLLYLIVYYVLSLTYRLLLDENGRVSCKKVKVEFSQNIEFE